MIKYNKVRLKGGKLVSIEMLVKNATGLPDKYVEMAVSYIHFLQSQYQQEEKTELKKKRQLGILSPKFHSMAEDFDQTPDCFKEYV